MPNDQRTAYASPARRGADTLLLLALSIRQQIHIRARLSKGRSEFAQDAHRNPALNEAQDPLRIANIFEVGIKKDSVAIENRAPKKSRAGKDRQIVTD